MPLPKLKPGYLHPHTDIVSETIRIEPQGKLVDVYICEETHRRDKTRITDYYVVAFFIPVIKRRSYWRDESVYQCFYRRLQVQRRAVNPDTGDTIIPPPNPLPKGYTLARVIPIDSLTRIYEECIVPEMIKQTAEGWKKPHVENAPTPPPIPRVRQQQTASPPSPIPCGPKPILRKPIPSRLRARLDAIRRKHLEGED